MIALRRPDKITTWFLLFWPRSRSRLVDIIVRGRFKHVSAVSYSEACRTWVYYDVRLGETEITLWPPGEDAIAIIKSTMGDCSILCMESRPSTGWKRVAFWLMPRFGFWCVPAMAHLVGLVWYGARPDSFWRCCIRNGAQVIVDAWPTDGHGVGPAMGTDGADGRAERAGAAGADAGCQAATDRGDAVVAL